MANTTVTITYSNGATREFVASDQLEEKINEGEMFSVTTMHSDMNISEEMSVSKMYVGNPISALGNMMVMRRNAEQLGDDEDRDVIIDIITACIAMLSDEVTSYQSGMLPCNDVTSSPLLTVFGETSVEGDVEAFTESDCETEGRMNCPLTNSPCSYYLYKLDCNGEVAIEHCAHPDNNDENEGNCTSVLCPFCPEIEGGS